MDFQPKTHLPPQSPSSGPSAQLHLLAQTLEAQVPLRFSLLGPRPAVLRSPGPGEPWTVFPPLPTLHTAAGQAVWSGAAVSSS